MTIAALIVAAGQGSRFGGDIPKQFAPLCGKAILFHSIETFESMSEFSRIWLVLPAEFISDFDKRFNLSGFSKIAGWVAGRERRQDSVWVGLSNLPSDTTIVAIHDAARPCVTPSDVFRAVSVAERMGAAILAAPATDTVKRTNADGRIVETLDRHSLWLAQTPQVFRFDLIRRAYAKVFDDGIEVTDDAVAVEHIGEPVEVIPSQWPNPKITTADDLHYVEWLLGRENRR